MPRLSSRFRRNGTDFLSLVLLPLLAALLPWSMSFALMRRLARDERLYGSSVEPAWEAARHYLPDADPAIFRFRFRLLRLTDQVDTYLTLLRSARWWRRRVVVRGEWPATTGPFLLLTYHWGAGGWVWKLLRQRGIVAHFVARRAGYRDMGLGGVGYWYGRFRGWAIRRIGCAGPIYLGGSTPHLRTAFAAGESVMGMLDLPPEPGRGFFQTDCLGRPMRFPRGLVDMAVAERLPVVLVSCGLDAASGRRDLHIEALPLHLDAEQIAIRYAKHFGDRLAAQPEYWQLWVVAPALFAGETAASHLPAGQST